MVAAADDLMENLNRPEKMRCFDMFSFLPIIFTTQHFWLGEGFYHDEEVGVGSREDGNVHRNTQNVGFVEPDAKIPLSAQQQEDEDADVHEAHASCG